MNKKHVAIILAIALVLVGSFTAYKISKNKVIFSGMDLDLKDTDERLGSADIVAYNGPGLKEGETAYKEGDYIYKIEGNEATIIMYDGNSSDVVIPSELNGFPVAVLGPSSFTVEEGLINESFQEARITSVVIPDTVRVIDINAFNGAKLTNLVIPEGVKVIKRGAFTGNELVSISFPKTLEIIESNPFTSNKIIYHDNSGNYINHSTLETIKIHPDNPYYRVIDNGLYTIDGEKIIIGIDNIKEGTKVVGEDAFRTMQKEINIPNSLVEIQKGAFIETGIKNLIIPEGVEFLGSHSFMGNTFSVLESIQLPKSLLVIDSNPFVGNPKLKKISIHKDNPAYKVIDNAIYTIDAKKLIVGSSTTNAVRKGTVIIGSSAFEDMELTSIVIPEGVKIISSSAFLGNKLTSINIPDSVELIGRHTFNRNKINKITFGKNLKAIGTSAFFDNDLTEVVLPDSIRNIEGLAFGANNISKLNLGNGIEVIGPDAFLSNQLSNIVIPESLYLLSDKAFNNNPINDINLPLGTKLVEYMDVMTYGLLDGENSETLYSYDY